MTQRFFVSQDGDFCVTATDEMAEAVLGDANWCEVDQDTYANVRLQKLVDLEEQLARDYEAYDTQYEAALQAAREAR